MADLSCFSISGAWKEINRILGKANLAAKLTDSANADFTIDLKSFSYRGGPAGENTGFWAILGLPGPPGNSANVYIQNTAADAPGKDLGTSVGRVMTHEFAHWGLQVPENYLEPGPLEEGILSREEAYLTHDNLAVLTKEQARLLQKLCKSRHGSGGGGGLGLSWGFGYWVPIIEAYFPGGETGDWIQWGWTIYWTGSTRPVK